MSFLTPIGKWFHPKRMESETAPKTTTKRSPLNALAVFAVTFVFALLIAVQPVSAEINLSVITEVVNAFVGIIDPIIDLVIAIVPLWFIIEILGFIMGLLAAILAMIKLGTR